jgi:putative aldouronate transport system substrate-binding protein
MVNKGFINIVLLVVLLVGCAPQVTPTPEPVSFSVLYNNRSSTPFSPDWRILQEYKSRQNVTLDVRLGDDADYAKAIVQALESTDIPDIILKVYPKSIEEYANSGVLLAFSDYESIMPNFTAYIKDNNLQAELDKLRLSNGKYYILPGYQRKIQVQQWIYRKDIFDANQMSAPATYDELFNDLLILKQKYPDSTPITATYGGAHLLAMLGAGYGIPAGWAGTQYYNSTQDHWQYAPATENYRAMYTFLNRLYAAGLLDPASFTQTDADFYAKLQDGRAFVTVTWITSGFANWNDQLKANGYPNAEWAALPVPASTIGLRALPAVDPFRKGLVVPASVVNKPYFERLIKFLDWAVYSEEGQTLTTWGVEGLTYENTANGKAYLPDIKTPRNPNGTVDISATYGFNCMFNNVENQEFEDYKKPPEIVAFLNRSLNANETLPLPPQLKLDAQSIEAIRVINDSLAQFVTDASTKFILGETDITPAGMPTCWNYRTEAIKPWSKSGMMPGRHKINNKNLSENDRRTTF